VVVVGDRVLRGEGPVAAVEDVARFGEGEQGGQGAGAGGQGCVKVELLQVAQDVPGVAARIDDDGGGQAGEAVGGVGQEAAAVGEDDLYVGVANCRPKCVKICYFVIR
jgi:hypothetical protein